MQNIMDNLVLHNSFAPVKSGLVNFRLNKSMVTPSGWYVLTQHKVGHAQRAGLIELSLNERSFQHQISLSFCDG